MTVISTPIGFVNWRSQTPQSVRYSLPGGLSPGAHTPSVFDETQKEEAWKFARALAEAIQDAGKSGWDGPGSSAVDIGALTRVRDFLNALPEDFPFPEPSIAPSGEILLEWSKSPQLSVAVLVGGVGQLHYAAYIRGSKTHGTIDFVGDELPQEFVLVATRWWKAS